MTKVYVNMYCIRSFFFLSMFPFCLFSVSPFLVNIPVDKLITDPRALIGMYPLLFFVAIFQIEPCKTLCIIRYRVQCN